jgi:hypothetical protein
MPTQPYSVRPRRNLYAGVSPAVVTSPQSPGDGGTRVGLWVIGNGIGAGKIDYVALAPVDPYYWWYDAEPTQGSFTARS